MDQGDYELAKAIIEGITIGSAKARGRLILTGGADELVEPMARMGKIPSYAEDVEGTLDDAVNALQTDTAIQLAKNKNQTPRYKRWDETFYDSPLIATTIDYFNFALRAGNEALNARAKAKTKADNKIKEINTKHPIEYEAIFKAVKEARYAEKAEKLTKLFNTLKIYSVMPDGAAKQDMWNDYIAHELT